MAHARALPHPPRRPPAALGPDARGLLVKNDHPRAIDHYIDYFGGGAPAVRSRPASDDPCGERWLERLG